MKTASELVESLIEQRDSIRGWIDAEAEYAVDEQRHLAEDAPERAYWHHGYQAALDDVIRKLTAIGPSDCSEGRSN